MKKELNRWLWILVAVLTIGLMACSKDEPISPEEPEQPEQPDNPGIAPEDPVEPIEDWEDEKPHGFIFDIDSIYMPLTEDGFLQFWDRNHKYFCDTIIMEERYKRPKDNRSKEGVLWGATGERALVRLVGKQKANPWVNVDKYIEMCRTIHVRADSKFSNFPELEDLPVSNLQIFGLMTVETLVNVDVISHKYFCADIPAGGSMRGPEEVWGGDMYAPYTLLECIIGEYIFKDMQRGPYVVGGPGPYSMLRMGNVNAKYIYPGMDLWINNYPDEPGEYPMTLRMEFANGTVLTKDFKVRYVNEE